MELPASLINAVLGQQRVVQFPHALYRYPARFSPHFAREVIEAFTSPGELVLDPFCGGGTAIVEALSLGRKAVGCDINTLATYITKVKTTPLSVHDKRELIHWLQRFDTTIVKTAEPVGSWHDTCIPNLPWRMQRSLGQILSLIDQLPKTKQRDFARLTLLCVAQAALDCPRRVPKTRILWADFKASLVRNLEHHQSYLTSMANQNAIARFQIRSLRRIIRRKAEAIGGCRLIPDSWLPARLVLTSPPYAGVHVLYHRWQTNGRRETPLPYWLVGQRNGHGEGYFTLGSRRQPGLFSYFKRLQAAFTAIASCLDGRSLVVQLVAFNRPTEHLPMYLQALANAGFAEEIIECKHPSVIDGRLWRAVPGRKWYAHARGITGSSREVLLLHRLVASNAR
jgi:DNA methylase